MGQVFSRKAAKEVQKGTAVQDLEERSQEKADKELEKEVEKEVEIEKEEVSAILMSQRKGKDTAVSDASAHVKEENNKEKMKESEKDKVVGKGKAKESIVSAQDDAVSARGWALDKDHLGRPLMEIYDSVDEEMNNKVHAEKLLVLLQLCDYEEALTLLSIGETWNNMKPREVPKALKTVVDYAESGKGSSGIQEKLRFIGYKLGEDSKKLKEEREFDEGVILVTLAMHGGVCHIQKEVGVNVVYGMIAQNMRGFSMANTIENIILRQLRQYRELVVEEVYQSRKNSFGKDKDNIHVINGFRNAMCPSVGLNVMPDIHYPIKIVAEQRDVQKFFNIYSVEGLTAWLINLVNNNSNKKEEEGVR